MTAHSRTVPRRRENRGLYFMTELFQGERPASSLMTFEYMDYALEYGIADGKDRNAFGKPIGSYQLWKHRFAELKSQVEAARRLSYRALDSLNRGEKASARSPWRSS